MDTYHGWALSTLLSTANTAQSLFTRVRGIEILGSSDAGSWIKPRNTSARWSWDGSIRARVNKDWAVLFEVGCLCTIVDAAGLREHFRGYVEPNYSPLD
jgi:hypothetical protein